MNQHMFNTLVRLLVFIYNTVKKDSDPVLSYKDNILHADEKQVL